VYSKTFSKLIAGSAGAVVLASALAACGGSSNNNGKGSGSGGASSGVVTQAGQGARLTGTYSALDFLGFLPNGLYPSDITELSGGSYNTDTLVEVNAKYSAATESCSTALATMGAPGYGEEAYLIDQGQNTSASTYYAYAVYEFATAAQASELVTAMAAKAVACGSFTATENGVSLPASFSIGPNSEATVPAANTAVDIRETVTNNGQKAVGDILFAADGNVVMVESASGTGTVPAEVSLTTVAQEELTALAKGEATDVSEGIAPDYTTPTSAPSAPGSSGARIGGGLR